MRASSRDGEQIAYGVFGEGSPAFVLVHGWCCDRRYWDAQVPALSACNQVVTLDLAGHGESTANRKHWSIAAFGADVAAVVEHLALGDVVLVGHSMGADVIVEAASHLKGRVRGLVWVDQHTQLSTFRSEGEVSERVAPFRADFTKTTRAFVRSLFPPTADRLLVERVAAGMSSAPPHIALAAMEATWNYARHVPAILRELDLPVVAINARCADTDGHSLSRCGVETVLISDVGHFPMLENPEAFNAALFRAQAGWKEPVAVGLRA